MKAQPFFLAIFFAIASSSHAQTTDQSTASNSTSAPDSSVIEASNTVAPKPQFGSLGEIQTAKKAALAERCGIREKSGVESTVGGLAYGLGYVAAMVLTMGISVLVEPIARSAIQDHEKACKKEVDHEYDSYVVEYNAKQEQESLAVR